jgi:hypothetical protein
MGSARTKDQEHSVEQQGKSMSMFQHVDYLLDLWNLTVLVDRQMPPSL